jgi:hypothetical protein
MVRAKEDTVLKPPVFFQQGIAGGRNQTWFSAEPSPFNRSTPGSRLLSLTIPLPTPRHLVGLVSFAAQLTDTR